MKDMKSMKMNDPCSAFSFMTFRLFMVTSLFQSRDLGWFFSCMKEHVADSQNRRLLLINEPRV